MQVYWCVYVRGHVQRMVMCFFHGSETNCNAVAHVTRAIDPCHAALRMPVAKPFELLVMEGAKESCTTQRLLTRIRAIIDAPARACIGFTQIRLLAGGAILSAKHASG